MSDEEKIIKLPVWSANMPMEGAVERLMKTTIDHYDVGRIHYPIKNGVLEVRLEPMSSMVLKRA